VLVLGRREEEGSVISYRLPSGQQVAGVKLDEFRGLLGTLIESKAYSVE
jgi:hypothetical protein